MSIESGIRNLDIFLDNNVLNIKKLPRYLVENWIKQLHPLQNITIKWNVIVVRQFLYFLRSLEIDAFIPDVPAYRSAHIPYAFSDEELDFCLQLRIISLIKEKMEESLLFNFLYT